MNPLEEIAIQDGLFAAPLVLQIAGLKLKLKAMQHEIDELKTCLARLEPHAQA
jgi:hypothetical protein